MKFKVGDKVKINQDKCSYGKVDHVFTIKSIEKMLGFTTIYYITDTMWMFDYQLLKANKGINYLPKWF